MPDKLLRIALVLLEDQQGRVALQLRSDTPEIVNPNKWGLFGGHIEEGETPAAGAQSDVEEELTCSFASEKLNYLEKREFGLEKVSYLFHYPITLELDEAKLTEAQHYGLFSANQIESGRIEEKEIVPYHREFLLAFWNGTLKLD